MPPYFIMSQNGALHVDGDPPTAQIEAKRQRRQQFRQPHALTRG